MRFRTISLLGLMLATAVSARAETSVGLSISIGNAPPPPVVVVREAPRLVYVPEARVYMASGPYGYDWFRSGMYWYIYDDGYWYRGTGYRGPYRVIETRYVPAAVWKVPPSRWRSHPHGGPPGQTKKSAYMPEGHGKGHGHK